MSSLAEHLAFLSQTVPALPGKIDGIGHDGQALDQAARSAVADFQQRREQATQLVDQLRHALEGLRDGAREDQQHLERAVHAVQDAAAQDAHELEEGTQQLQAAAGEAVHAMAALQASLGHAGEQTAKAHEEAHAGLHALSDQARSRRTELEGAAHQVTAAAKSAEEAVRQGEAAVGEGVSALKEAMGRLLQEAQQRLQQTRSLLDELHAQQEAAVADALRELETQAEHVENDLTGRVDAEMEQPLDHELAGLAGGLAETTQQLQKLHQDCSARREELEQQVASVSDRIPPLQAAVVQVKGAAEQAGIPWP